MSCMAGLKRRFDRCFGITPFFKNNDTWIYFVSLVVTIICLILYAQQLDENYDLTYGGILFILIMLDIGSNLMGGKQNCILSFVLVSKLPVLPHVKFTPETAFLRNCLVHYKLFYF